MKCASKDANQALHSTCSRLDARWMYDAIDRLLKTTVSGIIFPHLTHIPCQHFGVASGFVRRQASTHMSSERMSLVQLCHCTFFFFFFSGASDELADRHIIGTLLMFCIVSFAEQPLAAGRLALIYCLSNLPSKLRHQTRQSTVPPRVARSLADSSVRLRAGYADNEGNVNWNLKSDLKVSPCVEQLLPLPLILRLE